MRPVILRWKRNPDFPGATDEYLITATHEGKIERRATYIETLLIQRIEDFSSQRRILAKEGQR